MLMDGHSEMDPSNMVLTHIGHVLDVTPELHELADLPRSTEALWCEEGHWHRGPLVWDDAEDGQG